jgi:hypothetical protein
MRDLKIAIAGPSGVGKTTLAHWIANEYGIPFITTSTKPLWEKYNIQSHKELVSRTILNPSWGYQFQLELLEMRQNIIDTNNNFVTDRSPMDNLVYFLMQNTPYMSEGETEEYVKLCADALGKLDCLIQIPFTELINLEDDGKRIPNKYYQMTTNITFVMAAGLLDPYLKPDGPLRVTSLQMWDWDERVEKIKNFILSQQLIVKEE